MTILRFFSLSLLFLASACSASEQGAASRTQGRFAFAVLGDTPYSHDEETLFLRLIEDMNRDELAWVIHIGDIGRLFSCSDSLYRARFQQFQRIRHPVIYTPGDNEWTDCHMPSRGGFSPTERLVRLREVFFADPRQSLGKRSLPLTSQSQQRIHTEFVENTRWMYGTLVFMTIHVVGSHNGLDDFPARTAADDSSFARREAASLAWLREGFALARDNASKAIFIAVHADPAFEAAAGTAPRRGFTPFLIALEQEVKQFDGLVLLAHGDSHLFRIDHPLIDRRSGQRLSNFTRLEVFGAPDVGWVRVEVDTTSADLFSFEANKIPSHKEDG